MVKNSMCEESLTEAKIINFREWIEQDQNNIWSQFHQFVKDISVKKLCKMLQCFPKKFVLKF